MNKLEKCDDFLDCEEIPVYYFVMIMDWVDPNDPRPREILVSYCEKHKPERSYLRQITKEEYLIHQVLAS